MSLSSYFWSEVQKELLKKAYTEGEGLSEAQTLLPDKSRSTIAAQASRLALSKRRPRKNKVHGE